jgi:hypothetical protein
MSKITTPLVSQQCSDDGSADMVPSLTVMETTNRKVLERNEHVGTTAKIFGLYTYYPNVPKFLAKSSAAASATRYTQTHIK